MFRVLHPAKLLALGVASALVASCAGPSVAVTPADSGPPPSLAPVAPPGEAASPAGSAIPGSAVGTVRSPSPAPSVSMGRDGIPAFRHVYVIVMENREYGSVIGSDDAPYLNELANRYAILTAYTAVTHPSQPNYLALFSGSTQGVTDDGMHDIDAPSIADRLDASGRTWAVFAQNVPSGCFTGGSSSGGRDGGGSYARKHNPAISFISISGNPARCGRIHDFTAFDPAAADFELIVPNLCSDMHDCSASIGDGFLRDFVPRTVDAPSFAGSVLVITWDEGSSSEGGGGRVPTIVVSPLLPGGGIRSDRPHDHYGLLRTIEDAWGLPCLANSCGAANFRELFGR